MQLTKTPSSIAPIFAISFPVFNEEKRKAWGIPVSKEIDEIWHYWILETMEYKKLCRALQGGKFLHHRSNAYIEYFDKGIAIRGDNLRHQVAKLSIYVLNYGLFKKDRVKYWLLAAHLVEKCGWTVRQLDRWLATSHVQHPPGRTRFGTRLQR